MYIGIFYLFVVVMLHCFCAKNTIQYSNQMGLVLVISLLNSFDLKFLCWYFTPMAADSTCT